jgi:hypothetical protein
MRRIIVALAWIGHQNLAHSTPSDRGTGRDGTNFSPASVIVHRCPLIGFSHPWRWQTATVLLSRPHVVLHRRACVADAGRT